MSGHSKWSTIKRQKGTADAKRGQLFTKIARELIVAARQGGGDPEANYRLRLIMQKARDHNMPMDNIERAIKRGTGEGGEGVSLAEITYEGYGPGGTAILIQANTDNKNRTIAEIRNIFTRSNANLGEAGCVSWIFEHRGIITIDGKNVNSEELALDAIDAGADDVKIEDGYVEIYTNPEDLEKVRKALEEKNLPMVSVELAMIPKTLVDLDDKTAEQTLKFIDKLEDLDDIQHVYTNANFSNEFLENYQS